MNKEDSPKAYQCLICSCLQYGRNVECMVCGEELTPEMEISKQEFDELIQKARP